MLSKRKLKRKTSPTIKIKRDIKRGGKLAKNRKILKLSKKIFFFVFLLFTIIPITLFLKNNLFTIKKINCNFEQNDCSSENIAIDNNFYSLTFFNANSSRIEPYFYNSYPQIKSVSLQKIFPNTLVIDLISEQPIAQIKNKNNEYYFINQNGKVFKKAYNSKLTTIISDYSPIVGETFTNQALLASLEIIKIAKASFIPILELEILDYEFIKLNLNLDTKAYLNGNKNIEKQIDSLQFILKNSRLDNQKFSLIDLRFDNPIIK